MSSGSAKSPAEGLKNSECEQGVITTQPPILYVVEVDPYKKAKNSEIKTRLADGTNYQMVPFRSGTNKDYVSHLIAMVCLVEQLDLEKSIEAAFAFFKKVEETDRAAQQENQHVQESTGERDSQEAP